MSALAPLDEESAGAVSRAIDEAAHFPPRQELMTEGREIAGPRLFVDGWAARVRLLADGRRQLINFLLPGDLIGYCSHARPLAVSTVVTLTNAACTAAPSPGDHPALREAYDTSRAIEEAHLLSQITRLGRLSARERIADLLLELYERLSLSGLATDGRFAFPLTQETVADALGLTPVHLSRTLQIARRRGEFECRGGQVTLADPEQLARMVGRSPVAVSFR